MNKMRYFRIKKGLSLKEMSETTSVAIGYISDLERGVRTNPSKDVMTEIAKALGETVQTIFFEEENNKN